MKDPTNLYDACRSSLVRCLSAVSEQFPNLPDNMPPLHRLRNLVQVLAANAPAHCGSHAEELTIDAALTLLSTSQELLETLREDSPEGRVSGEMYQALTETMTALQARIGGHLRQQRARRVRGLYVIIDPQVTNGRDPLEVARAAVQGGASMLQLRDKLRDKGEILPLATTLQSLCQAHDVDLIINDQVDLAVIVGSAGVHVGQSDLPVAEVRRILSSQQVVGRSNHELAEVEQSQEMGADHVAFGAIYATSTKGVGRPPQGVDRLRQARKSTQLPLVAIGGINAENVAPVVEAGADAICVTAAVGMAPDPEAATGGLVEAIREAGGRV